MKIHRLNYEQYAIDYLEGNLSPELQEEMEQLISENPEIGEELEGVERLVLIPDTEITYDKKDSLIMEESSGGKKLYYYISAAAVIILLITAGIWLFTAPPSDYSDPQVAENSVPVNHEKSENEIATIPVKDENKTENTTDDKVEKESTGPQSTDSKSEPEAMFAAELGQKETTKDPEPVKENRNIATVEQENKDENISGQIAGKNEKSNNRSKKTEPINTHLAAGSMQPLESFPRAQFATLSVPELREKKRIEMIENKLKNFLEAGQERGLVSETVETEKINLESVASAIVPQTFNFLK